MSVLFPNEAPMLKESTLRLIAVKKLEKKNN